MPKRKTVVEMTQGIITSDALETALSTAQPIIRQYLAALIEENRKAQADIIKMKAKDVTQGNRAKEAEERAQAAELELEKHFRIEVHHRPENLLKE